MIEEDYRTEKFAGTALRMDGIGRNWIRTKADTRYSTIFQKDMHYFQFYDDYDEGQNDCMVTARNNPQGWMGLIFEDMGGNLCHIWNVLDRMPGF